MPLPGSQDRILHTRTLVGNFLYRRIDPHDLRDERTWKLCADTSALALAVPGTEQQCSGRQFQQRRRVRGLRSRESPALLALHERLATQKAVSDDRVIDPMWGVQRCDALQRLQSRTAEINGDVRTTGTGRSGYTRVDLQPRTIAVDTDRQVHESACDE